MDITECGEGINRDFDEREGQAALAASNCSAAPKYSTKPAPPIDRRKMMLGDDRRATVVWIDAKVELPDDEMTVLMAMEDGEVWPGFHENEEWRYFDAAKVAVRVTHWCEFPSCDVEAIADTQRRCPTCGQKLP